MIKVVRVRKNGSVKQIRNTADDAWAMAAIIKNKKAVVVFCFVRYVLASPNRIKPEIKVGTWMLLDMKYMAMLVLPVRSEPVK